MRKFNPCAFCFISRFRDLIFVMKDTVKIGFIGTGFARRVQIPSFLKCGGAEIISVASFHLENAEATAKEFNIPHFTDDWQDTVSREDVDLICITTPPDTHYEMTLRALELGKHVLCDKPMAIDVSEAQTMTAMAKAEGVLALIDHELRFQKGRLKAFEMLRDGAIGKIRHAKYRFRAPHRSDANLPWTWWSDKESGGGALGAIGSHVIDSFNWFLGTEISQVFCQLQTHIKQRLWEETSESREVTSDDESNLIVRFADGDLTEDATGMISISMVEYPNYQNVIEFYGTDGALRINFRGEIEMAKSGEKDWREIDVGLGKLVEGVADTGFSRGFMEFAPKIVEAIREGKTEIEHAATFADGLKVQKVLDASHASHESGCLVKIK